MNDLGKFNQEVHPHELQWPNIKEQYLNIDFIESCYKEDWQQGAIRWVINAATSSQVCWENYWKKCCSPTSCFISWPINTVIFCNWNMEYQWCILSDPINPHYMVASLITYSHKAYQLIPYSKICTCIYTLKLVDIDAYAPTWMHIHTICKKCFLLIMALYCIYILWLQWH